MKNLKELADKIMEVAFRDELNNKLYTPNSDFVTGILGCTCDIDYEKWYQQTILTYCWVKKWYCTDTTVGTRAYLFDGKIVAFSRQTGRKHNEEFMWISNSDFHAVEKYLENFVVKPNRSFYVANGDELAYIMSEINDGYHIDSYCALCHETAYLGDVKVTIPPGWESCPDRKEHDKAYYLYKDVMVILPSGEKKSVKMSDLVFKEID